MQYISKHYEHAEIVAHIVCDVADFQLYELKDECLRCFDEHKVSTVVTDRAYFLKEFNYTPEEIAKYGLKTRVVAPLAEVYERWASFYKPSSTNIHSNTTELLTVPPLTVQFKERLDMALTPAVSSAKSGTPSPTTHSGAKIGRNDLCPMGTGLKFKKCCGAEGHTTCIRE
jgi:hypothetical protein